MRNWFLSSVQKKQNAFLIGELGFKQSFKSNKLIKILIGSNLPLHMLESASYLSSSRIYRDSYKPIRWVFPISLKTCPPPNQRAQEAEAPFRTRWRYKQNGHTHKAQRASWAPQHLWCKKSLKIPVQNRVWKDQKCLIVKLHRGGQDDYYSQRRKRGIYAKSSQRNIITKNSLHENQMQTEKNAPDLGM